MSTPSATAPAGLLLPLTVKHSGRGIGCFSIYDANGSSLGIDFEEDTAGAIVNAVNTHFQLLAALRELLDAELAQSPWYRDGKEAQDAWADRRAKARNDAAALIAKCSP